MPDVFILNGAVGPHGETISADIYLAFKQLVFPSDRRRYTNGIQTVYKHPQGH